MESLSATQQKELKIELRNEKEQQQIKQKLMKHLNNIQQEKTKPLATSFSKKKWLKKHPQKTIDDYNKALATEEENTQKDLRRINQEIDRISHTIDSLQRKLERPHMQEGQLDID